MTIRKVILNAVKFAVENAEFEDLLNEEDLSIEELTGYLMMKADIDLAYRQYPGLGYLEDKDWDTVQEMIDKQYKIMKEELI